MDIQVFRCGEDAEILDLGHAVLLEVETVVLGVEVSLGGQGSGDGEALHRCAVPVLIHQITQSIVSEVDHGIGNSDGQQRRAVGKCIAVNGLQPLGEGDLAQAGAALKGIGANAGHFAGNLNGGQAGAAAKDTMVDGDQPAGQGDRFQAGAVCECTAIDTHNAVRNRDGFQTGAALECPTDDFFQTAGEDDALQPGAARKGFIVDICYFAGKLDGFQAGAVLKSALSNGGDAVRQCDGAHFTKAQERIVSNGGDTGFHHNAGDQLTLVKPGCGGAFSIVCEILGHEIVHLAGAADGQGGAGDLPGQLFAAGAFQLHAVQHHPAAHQLKAAVRQNLLGEFTPGDAAGAILVAHDPAPAGNRAVGIYMLALGNSADNGEVNAYIRVDLQIHLGQTGIYEFRGHKAVFDAGKAVFLGVEVTLGGPGRGDGEALHLGKDGLTRLCVPGPENTEAVIHQLRHRAGDGHCLQLRAVLESTEANAGDALRNVDGGQSGTVVESVVSDAFKGAGQADGGQIPAPEESVVANGGDALFHNNTLDTIDLVVPGSHDVTAGIFIEAVVRHGAAAADGHGAVLGQLPGEVLAAGTAENLFGVSQIDPALYRCLAGVGQLCLGVAAAPFNLAGGVVLQAEDVGPSANVGIIVQGDGVQDRVSRNGTHFHCRIRVLINGHFSHENVGIKIVKRCGAALGERDSILHGVEVGIAGPLAGDPEIGHQGFITGFVILTISQGVLTGDVDTFGNGNLLQVLAVIECIAVDGGSLTPEGDLTQSAVCKRVPIDVGIGGNGDGGEVVAVAKGLLPDSANAVRQCDGA